MSYYTHLNELTNDRFKSRIRGTGSPRRETITVVTPNGNRYEIEVENITGDDALEEVSMITDQYTKTTVLRKNEDIKEENRRRKKAKQEVLPLLTNMRESGVGVEWDSWVFQLTPEEAKNPVMVEKYRAAIEDWATKVRFNEFGYTAQYDQTGEYTPDPDDKCSGFRVAVIQDMHTNTKTPHFHVEVHRIPYILNEEGELVKAKVLTRSDWNEREGDKKAIEEVFKKHNIVSLAYGLPNGTRATDLSEEFDKHYIEGQKTKTETTETEAPVAEAPTQEAPVAETPAVEKPEHEEPVTAKEQELPTTPVAEVPTQKPIVTHLEHELTDEEKLNKDLEQVEDSHLTQRLTSRFREAEKAFVRAEAIYLETKESLERARAYDTILHERNVFENKYNDEIILRRRAEGDVEKIKQESDQKLNNLSAELNEATLDHATLADVNKGLVTRADALASENAGLKQQNNALTNELKEIKEALDEEKKAVDVLDKQVAAANRAVTSLNNEKIDLQEKLEAKDKEVSKLNGDIKTKEKSITTLNTTLNNERKAHQKVLEQKDKAIQEKTQLLEKQSAAYKVLCQQLGIDPDLNPDEVLKQVKEQQKKGNDPANDPAEEKPSRFVQILKEEDERKKAEQQQSEKPQAPSGKSYSNDNGEKPDTPSVTPKKTYADLPDEAVTQPKNQPKVQETPKNNVLDRIEQKNNPSTPANPEPPKPEDDPNKKNGR